MLETGYTQIMVHQNTEGLNIMRKILGLFLLITLTIGGNLPPSVAQDDGESRVVITPENVDQLVELQRFEALPFSLPNLSSDGTTVAVETDIGLEFYNVETREMIHRAEMDIEVRSLEFSNDGKRLAIVGSDSALRIIDIETGNQDIAIEDFESRANVIEWSLDGQMIATGRVEVQLGIVEVWDTYDGSLLYSFTFEGGVDSGGIRGIEFSPDNRAIAVGMVEANTQLLILESGEQILGVEHFNANTLAISPDGNYLATGSYESGWYGGSNYVFSSFQIWDMTTGAGILPDENDIGSVTNAVFSGDGETVYVSTGENIVLGIDALSGDVVEDYGHIGRIESLLFVEDDLIAFVANPANTSVFEVINLSSDTHIGTFPNQLGRSFSPDLTRMVVTRYYEIQLVDLDSNEVILSVSNEDSGVFSSDNRWWLTVNFDDSSIWLRDATTGEVVRQLEAIDDAVCSTSEFTPDNELIYCRNVDNETMWLWDVETGELVANYTSDNIRGLIRFSPYGVIALVFVDFGMILIDIYTGELVSILGGMDYLAVVSFSEDNQTVFTLSGTGIGELFDIATGESIAQYAYVSSNNYIRASSLLHDGKEMILGYDNGIVIRYLIPFPDTLDGGLLAFYETHETTISRAEPSPNEQLLITMDLSLIHI